MAVVKGGCSEEGSREDSGEVVSTRRQADCAMHMVQTLTYICARATPRRIAGSEPG